MEAARFFAVAVAGLALDLGVAWCVVRLVGLPLWLAATLGFAVAAVANYAAHELWTFRNGAQRLSGDRALRYGVALAATLSTRVATVAALAALVGNAYALPVLLAGVGVSFFFNYAISKHFIFRPEAKTRETSL